MWKSYYESLKSAKKTPAEIESERKLQEKEESLHRAIKDMIEQWKKKNYSAEALKQWK